MKDTGKKHEFQVSCNQSAKKPSASDAESYASRYSCSCKW